MKNFIFEIIISIFLEIWDYWPRNKVIEAHREFLNPTSRAVMIITKIHNFSKTQLIHGTASFSEKL